MLHQFHIFSLVVDLSVLMRSQTIKSFIIGRVKNLPDLIIILTFQMFGNEITALPSVTSPSFLFPSWS